tara:strand:+ start:2136 stop:2399 length:264 start_codon:yes stop_codon:yes gene_type:complete
MKFRVKWEVEYYDHDIKLYCDIDQDEDNVKTLDDIFTFLSKGLEESDTFTPEINVEFHDGDFNIEYVVIYDQDGKVLYEDPEYNKNY